MLECKLEDQCCEKIISLGGVARKMKDLGVRGWPDRLVILPGRIVFFIEFKRPDGRRGSLSVQQIKIRRMLTRLGVPVYVIDNYEDFEAALAKEK